MDNKYDDVVYLMLNDWDFAQKCLIYLYKQQEQEEREDKATHESNHKGFNKSDAKFLSTMAELVLSGAERVIDDPKREEIKSRLEKYSTQLACAEEIVELLR